MTHRLLVNPGTPKAWEILLKPGSNRIGRGEQNDFQVAHPSVSGAHCEIEVSSAGALLKDLGSTNGTFVNHARVHEAILQSGQHVQLGLVDMVFESRPISATTAPEASALPPRPPTVTIRLTGGRASSAASPATPPPAAEPEPIRAEPPLAPPIAAPVELPAGGAFCKSHGKTPARFYCGKCQKYFCDLCVSTHTTTTGTVKTCRACGGSVTPVQVSVSRPTPGGFYAALPGAFIYPFRGFGIVILLLAAGIFGGTDYLNGIGFLIGPYAWFLQIAIFGLLFLFLQNIIHTTTADENEPLGFPEFGGLFSAAWELAVTMLVSFGPAVAATVLGVALGLPGAVIIGAYLFGCFYFPMAFLAVAMKDSVLAANPLVVIPTILRLPLEYLVTSILLMSVLGIRQIGAMAFDVAAHQTVSTRNMTTLLISLAGQALWGFGSVYLLTVMARVLGLLYNHKKDQFGWFSH